MKTLQIDLPEELAQKLQVARKIYGEPYASDQIRAILGRWADRVLTSKGRPSVFQIGINALLEMAEISVKEKQLKRIKVLPTSSKDG